MSSYNMPPDTSAREKIVGGILDITQLAFLLIGLVIGLLIGLMLKGMFGTAGIVIGIVPCVLVGLIFCFLKIKGLSLVQYIKYKNKPKKKTKKIPNVRLCALTQEEKNQIRNF